MQATQKIGQVLLLIFLMMLVGAIVALPMVDSASMMVCIVCGGVGIGGLSLIRDPRERNILLWIFCAAYGLRVVFTIAIYSLDLITVLGGADDTGWQGSWLLSRYWRGWLGYIPTIKRVPGQGALPDTIWQVYDRTRTSNLGYYFFVAKLFYILDVPSQMVVSFINCFMNSITAVVIYKLSRDFFSEKASLLAAGAAVIFPGFLAWSALSIKETWLILFEVTALFTVWRAVRDRNVLWGLLCVILIVVVQGIRFYVSWVLVMAGILAVLCFRSPRPKATTMKAVGALLLLYVVASGLGIIHFDIAQVVQQQMESFDTFRSAISGGSNSQRTGTNTGVQLPYDPSTPGGAIMLILVGAIYLLLSPFPWQLSGKQLFTLPDVLLWWALVFGYIIPGIRYAWQRQGALCISLCAYLMPLILLYSLVFGNIGLAYRQRAQLMPFFLIFAAAGYDARERKRRGLGDKADANELLAQLKKQVKAMPAPTGTATVTAAVPSSKS